MEVRSFLEEEVYLLHITVMIIIIIKLLCKHFNLPFITILHNYVHSSTTCLNKFTNLIHHLPIASHYLPIANPYLPIAK